MPLVMNERTQKGGCPVSKHICLLTTTINRREALIRLLDSLVVQTYPHFTLFLGDQNPKGYLQDILREYAPRLDIEYYSIPPQSLSCARNVLLPYVKGEIVALTDDDCHYPPDALENVAHAFLAHDDMDVLIGCPFQEKTRSSFFAQQNRYTVFKAAPSWLLFFRRSVMERVGNFDENFGIGAQTPYQSGEETDYVLRAMDKGATVCRSSEVFVHHPPLDEKKADLTKARGYALRRMELLRKHNLPVWFKILNVVMPLCSFTFFFRRRYRLAVFRARLKGLFAYNDAQLKH